MLSGDGKHDESVIEKAVERIIPELSAAAEKLAVDQNGVVALDWMNGRRTPDANQLLKGAVNLVSTAVLFIAGGTDFLDQFGIFPDIRNDFSEHFTGFYSNFHTGTGQVADLTGSCLASCPGADISKVMDPVT